MSAIASNSCCSAGVIDPLALATFHIARSANGSSSGVKTARSMCSALLRSTAGISPCLRRRRQIVAILFHIALVEDRILAPLLRQEPPNRVEHVPPHIEGLPDEHVAIHAPSLLASRNRFVRQLPRQREPMLPLGHRIREHGPGV